MAFRFPLQKVLDVKEKEKEQAQLEFSLTVKKLHEAQEQLASLLQEHSRVQYQLLGEAGKGSTASALLDYHHYVHHLERQIDGLQYKLGSLEREVEAKKHVLVEKAKAERMWQEWKGRSLQAYNEKAAKLEQEMLDEMAAVRYFRGQAW